MYNTVAYPNREMREVARGKLRASKVRGVVAYTEVEQLGDEGEREYRTVWVLAWPLS